MPKVFIHIGAVKTGSTTIQEYFSGFPLSEKLIYFPAGLQFVGHHGIAAAIMGDKKFDWMHDYSKAKLVVEIQQIESNSGSDFLVSSEVFSTFEFISMNGLDQLRELFGEYEIEIIHYVRNQIALLESSFLQVAKTGAFHGDIKEWFSLFIDRKVGDFAYTTEMLGKIFGPENLNTICFDEVKTDLLGPVEKIVGISLPRNRVPVFNKSSLLTSLVLQTVARDTGMRLIGDSAKRLRERAETFFSNQMEMTIVPLELQVAAKKFFSNSNSQLQQMTGVDLNKFINISNRPVAHYTQQDIEREKSRLLMHLSKN